MRAHRGGMYMVSEATRGGIWGGMLTAEMNMLYWDAMIRRFNNFEWFAKIILAMTSSAVVGGWLLLQIPALWKGLSVISAIAAIVLPTIDVPGRVGRMANV